MKRTHECDIKLYEPQIEPWLAPDNRSAYRSQIGLASSRNTMKTADRENPSSCDRLCNKPSPWGGRQEAPSLNRAGWKVRTFPAQGEVFFLTFPFMELHGAWKSKLGNILWA